jgi:hypothetical protein
MMTPHPEHPRRAPLASSADTENLQSALVPAIVNSRQPGRHAVAATLVLLAVAPQPD